MVNVLPSLVCRTPNYTPNMRTGKYAGSACVDPVEFGNFGCLTPRGK